jgi:hypothetical protein
MTRQLLVARVLNRNIERLGGLLVRTPFESLRSLSVVTYRRVFVVELAGATIALGQTPCLPPCLLEFGEKSSGPVAGADVRSTGRRGSLDHSLQDPG